MTDTPMTPDREQEIRERLASTLKPQKSEIADLLAEVDRLRAALEAATCRCYDPIDHEPECTQATFTWDGVKYNAAAWYRDAEGVWWMACGVDSQGQPLMRVRNDRTNEPVPVSEVESDYGPLYRSDAGPDDLDETTPW